MNLITAQTQKREPFSELAYLPRSNNKKLIEGNFCNITTKRSAIEPLFHSVS